MSRSTAGLLWRLVLPLALLAISSACGSSGCQGCTPTPIPGGFPAQHRFNNAMQVRLSSTGVDFVEQNFDALVQMLVPTGLSFTIPPTDCTSSSQKVCCGAAPTACSVTATVSSVNVTPTAPSTMKVELQAQVKTTPIKFEKKLLFYWLSCDVTYNSAKAYPNTLGLKSDVNLVVDQNNQNKLSIVPTNTTLVNFGCNDIDISGGIDCTIADWLCPLFSGTLQSQMVGTLDSTLATMLKTLPMGQEGRFDVASFLSAYSPRTTGLVDYLLWAGGYAEAENSGMSVGVLGGFRPAKYSACVPSCEKVGATCTPPSGAAIPRSLAFRGNARPDGKPFDVGIGVDTKSLDLAAYAMYASGGLCLDVSTQSFAQLSSATFGLLIPSISSFTAGKVLPMMIAVRPRQPPTVTLGKGTYHKDATGKIVMDDPLLKIVAKDFAIDVYLQLDERMVRLFTVVAKLEVPVLLYADASGRLQPMLGALDQALTEVRVENGDLITEDPKALAQALPTILSLAAGFLASGFDPIELPSIQKLKLVLDGGSITTTDANKVLAIFATLGLVKTTGAGAGPGGQSASPGERVRGRPLQEALWVPPTEAFRLGPSFDPRGGPRLTVRTAADLPPELAGQPLEWAFRVDGGFYEPWVSDDDGRLVIQHALFWLQGEHTVELMARVVGRPETTADPTQLRITIDTIAPEVRLVPVPGGVRAEVRDPATRSERIELSWSIDGAPFSSFGQEREARVPEGTPVAVRARDATGNLGSASTVSQAITAAPLEEGGCSLATFDRPSFPLLGILLVPLGLALVALALVLARRRRS